MAVDIDFAPFEHCDRLAAGADAVVLVTEWHELRDPDLTRLKATMRTPVLVDGRNVWHVADARAEGFTYYGIGRP